MFKSPLLQVQYLLGHVALIVDSDNDNDKQVPTFWVKSGD